MKLRIRVIPAPAREVQLSEIKLRFEDGKNECIGQYSQNLYNGFHRNAHSLIRYWCFPCIYPVQDKVKAFKKRICH